MDFPKFAMVTPEWAKAIRGDYKKPQDFMAWLIARRLNAVEKKTSPRGLGGYDLEYLGPIRLDKKQRTPVKHFRAVLRERNKYYADGGLR